MKHLRYYSEFFSRDNVPYRIEIWQENAAAYTPRRITLTGDPVEIEWSEVEKLEPVHSSSATLNIISLSDREFADLYTVEPGAIRLDILRRGTLYWSGTLDTELYEEPYSYKNRYATSVTFSDFAVLDRLDWQERGIKTIAEILDLCLQAAAFNYGPLEKHISTKLSEGYTGDLLADCALLGDNFFDEDDEPFTIREVLDGVLRPYALRLKQKNGKLYLYDINAIQGLDPVEVQWRAADAELGVEPVYNKVTITFSPYAQATLIDGSLDADDVADHAEGLFFDEMIQTNRRSGVDGFTIHYGSQSKDDDPLTLKNGAYLFHIEPEYSGSKEAGIMWGYRPENDWRGNYVRNPFNNDADVWPSADRCKEIVVMPRRYVLTDEMSQYRLRVTLEVLFDVRYNPFESADVEDKTGHPNEKGNWGKLNAWVNYGYIPFQLLAYDNDGNLRYYYDNDNLRTSATYAGKGTWRIVANDPAPQKMVSWLCFYNQSNRESNTGFGGWQKNKKIIGNYSGDLPSAFTVDIDGELCSLPPIPGFLEFKIFSGVWRKDNDRDNPYRDIYSIARWLLYKNPKVTITKANGKEIEEEDVEVSAWLNKQAKDDYDIDTIIGTPRRIVPSGRGYILRASDYSAIREFHRAGVTDSLERLLAGTVYSNYAQRMNTLSGTVALIPDAEVLSDISSVDSRYMLLSEVQNLAAETSEIKMAEIAPDSYEGIEYEK